jgi:fatty-acid desaturase
MVIMSTTQPATAVSLHPSLRSWFYHAPGELPTMLWIIGIHVLSIVGLIFLPLPSWPVLVVAFIFLCLGGLGTTVCYHRALAHRALMLNPVVENILIFFAMLNGSGKPRTWVSMHRLHHATSDREDDISSPHFGGFWWSHLRWLWQADQSRSVKFGQDLTSTRYRFWDSAQIPVLGISLFGGLLWPEAIGADLLTACLWIGPIRLLWALHVQCSVNSLCHLGAITSEHGSGRNIWWLSLAHMCQGENWHANHHQRQADPRLGKGWQIDLGWWTIRLLAMMRLAKRVRVLSSSSSSST